MADTRLRDLERAAAAGDADAEVNYIRERMRAGLPEAQVELLAHCLHPPAYEALGWELVEGFDHIVTLTVFRRPGQKVLYKIHSSMESWPYGLKRWGREASIRAGLAAAWNGYSAWLARCQELKSKDLLLPVKPDEVRSLLLRIESSLDLPPGSPAGTLDSAQLRADGMNLFSPVIQRGFSDLVESTDPLGFPRAPGAEVLDFLIPFFAGRLGSFCHSGKYEDLAISMRTCSRDHGDTLAAIRDELVPWVLGWERQEGRHD